MKVAVVGAGVSGLAVAYHLSRSNNHSVCVFEAQERWGGCLDSLSYKGMVLERGCESIVQKDPAGLGILTELGLEERKQGTVSHGAQSSIWQAGSLKPIPRGMRLMAPVEVGDFIRSSLLSWPGKLRVGLERFVPAEPKDDESLAHFVIRRFGQECLDHLAQPLVAGIYAADPFKLSLRSTFPEFLNLEQEYGSVTAGLLAKKKASGQSSEAVRYSRFFSFPRGISELTDSLAQAIGLDNIALSTSVTALRKTPDGVELKTSKGEQLFDHVVIAMPTPAIVTLLNHYPELQTYLASQTYHSVATVNLVYPRFAWDGVRRQNGFVCPASESGDIMACTFSSWKYAGRGTNEQFLARTYFGRIGRDDPCRYSDEALVNLSVRDLRRMAGVSISPEYSVVSRYSQAMPAYEVGHQEWLSNLELKLQETPWMSLLGNGFYGVGVPHCLAQGFKIARKIERSLS